MSTIQHSNTFERCKGRVVEPVHIARIGQRPEPKNPANGYGRVPVRRCAPRRTPPAPSIAKSRERFGNLVRRDNRRIAAARGLYEAIAETRHDAFQRARIGEHIDAPAHVDRDHAQIVEAVELVGMIVRDQHAVERRRTCVQQFAGACPARCRSIQPSRRRAISAAPAVNIVCCRFLGLPGSQVPQYPALSGPPSRGNAA